MIFEPKVLFISFISELTYDPQLGSSSRKYLLFCKWNVGYSLVVTIRQLYFISLFCLVIYIIGKGLLLAVLYCLFKCLEFLKDWGLITPNSFYRYFGLLFHSSNWHRSCNFTKNFELFPALATFFINILQYNASKSYLK